MSSPKYPRRESFSAHRFVRLLTKTAAAQELGPEVVWLLTVIAHQEDAKRYSGAVTYWNEQLMPLCGFRSKGRLMRARQSAVDSGWLHYESGGRNQAGRYWCLIPDGFEQLPDGPCDESDPFQNRTANGTDETQEFQNRTANGTQTEPKRNSDGALSTLTLDPSPKGGTTSPGPSLFDSIKEEWNKAGLRQCRTISETRRRVINARSKDPDWLAHWREAVSRAGQSSFCRGKNDRGWTANIAWFLKPDTVTKLLEGNYDDPANGKPSGDAEASRVMREYTAQNLAESRGGVSIMSSPGDALRIRQAFAGCGDKELMGSILTSESALEQVASIIEPKHITDDRARIVYEAALKLWKAGKPVMAETVYPLVVGQDVTDDDLIELLESVPHGLHADYHARRVLDSWKKREFTYSAKRAQEELTVPECDIDEIIHSHVLELESLSSGDAESDGHIGDHLLTLADEPETEQLPSGLADLDAVLTGGGFAPGQMIAIGARPSVGKTALCAGIALAVAERNVPALILSLEMSAREMTERFLRQAGLKSIADTDGVNRLSNHPLYVREAGGWTIDKVECQARRYSRQHGVRLVLIDYLSLVQPRDRRQARHEQVGDISRSLKRLALQCNLVVIAAQQLNRDIEKRDSGRPRMSDFRDSGSIEQDADILIGLERPIRPDAGDITRGVLHVMKQRNGPTAELAIGFDPRRQHFHTVTQW